MQGEKPVDNATSEAMRFFHHRFFRIGILLLGIFAFTGMVRSLYGQWHRRDIVEERRQAVAKLEVENKRLVDRLTEATGSAFVEKQARNKLGLVRQGEVVVLMEKPEGVFEPLATPGAILEANPPESNWKLWWKLFF